MSSRTHTIPVYTALRGHAIGVGNPDSIDPKTDAISLLCAVTFLPVTSLTWSKALRGMSDIREATESIIRVYGGIIILRPSDLHLSKLARFPLSAEVGEC
jgi:hypothetical protein